MCIAADSIAQLRERLKADSAQTTEVVDQNAGSHQPTPTMSRRAIMEQLTNPPRQQ